ncbi:MAG: hypothetical protein HQK96_03180, partial [Nitrospirae bacterium]|nr:hypothetical protein [Nitrospirota bacterium]
LGARKDAIAIAEERFERRLVEESGKLRLEIEKVRSELRVEIEKVRSELSVKIEKSGKENVKWMFLFWIGQLAAMAALLKFFIK